MKIAIDTSPLSNKRSKHSVRGVGFYTQNLKEALLRYFPNNYYEFLDRNELPKKSVDLIHYPYFDPFFLTLPLIKKNKWVVTVHDLTPLLFPKHVPAGILGNIRWRIQKKNLLRADAIITDSYASRDDIANILNIKKEKIHVVHLAPAEIFKPIKNEESKQNIIDKYKVPKKFVLYVGDVTWNKNLPLLVQAIKRLNIHMIMVGKTLAEKDFDRDNPWNEDLVKVHELIDNDNRFIRLGFVSSKDLVGIYNLASLLVFPSIYEGFGLPIIEAMSSGCPVVTSNIGAMKEIGGDSVKKFNHMDVNSLSDAISEVFSNLKLQKELSEKGLSQAANFTWQKTAENTIGVYKSIIFKT